MLVGYPLAQQITTTIGAGEIDQYILPVVVLIVLISILPILIEVARGYFERRRNRRLASVGTARDE